MGSFSLRICLPRLHGDKYNMFPRHSVYAIYMPTLAPKTTGRFSASSAVRTGSPRRVMSTRFRSQKHEDASHGSVGCYQSHEDEQVGDTWEFTCFGQGSDVRV